MGSIIRWVEPYASILNEHVKRHSKMKTIVADLAAHGRAFSAKAIAGRLSRIGTSLTKDAPNTKWNAENFEYLMSRAKAGVSASIIRDEFEKNGVVFTRNAVLGKLWRHDMCGRAVIEKKPNRVAGGEPRKKRVLKPKSLVVESKPITHEERLASIFKPDHSRAGVPLLEATRFECHYPIDRTDDLNRPLCCGDTVTRGTYCTAHAEIMYARPTTMSRPFSANRSRFNNYGAIT